MYGPPCDKHLQNSENIFNENPKFTIIEKKKKNASLPKHRENFWTLRLETLSLQNIWTYS